MAYLPSPRVLVVPLVLAAALLGCAHPKPTRPTVVARPAPPPQPPPPPPPKVARLVVLPLDKLALPEAAEEINTKLAHVKLAGAGDATMATVSMETAQLQSECAEPTDGCYLRIARLVEADRLLWAQVEKIGGKGKKRKAKASTRIQVILFDRDKLGVSGQAEETYPAAVTGEDLDKLIASAVGSQMATPAGAAMPAPIAPAPVTARPGAPAPAPAPPPTPAPQPAPRPATPPPAAAPPSAYPPSAYPPPAAAPPSAYPPPATPPAAAPPPAAYPPPAAAPPPAAYPPAATPPAASVPPVTRMQ